MTDEWYKRAKLEEMREQTKVMHDILVQLTAIEMLITSRTFNNIVKLSSDYQISEDMRARCRETYLKTIEEISEMESNK